MVNQKLLEACKAALECIARLTPFPNPDAPEEIQFAMSQAAEYADEIRSKLQNVIYEATLKNRCNKVDCPAPKGLCVEYASPEYLKCEHWIGDELKYKAAFMLLKRLVEEGEPFIKDGIGYTRCFFCEEDCPDHAKNCIYLEAKKLLGVTGAKKQKVYDWISVEEKLPPNARWVWVYGPIQPEPTIAAYHADEKKPTWYVQPFREPWYWTTEGISHWLPIEAAIQAQDNNALHIEKS